MGITNTIRLLDKSIPVSEIGIGDCIDVALIPERYNEKRISVLIEKITGDDKVAGLLTAQERYALLLTHLSVSSNPNDPNDDYLGYITSLPGEPISRTYQEKGIAFNALLGRHVELLEIQCEHAYDWDIGRMACQLSGDFNQLIGMDLQWEPLDADALQGMTLQDLDNEMQVRFEQISKLAGNQAYNTLADLYFNGQVATSHLVDLSIDNNGLVVERGEGDAPVRFRALYHLTGHADNIIRCVAATSNDDDGTRSNVAG